MQQLSLKGAPDLPPFRERESGETQGQYMAAMVQFHQEFLKENWPTLPPDSSSPQGSDPQADSGTAPAATSPSSSPKG